MKDEIKLVLQKLGYREMGKDVWAKPVSYHFFSVAIKKKKLLFQNHFVGANGKMFVWNSAVLEEKEFVANLKMAEYEADIKTGMPGSSDFGFLTVKEHYENLL